MKTARPAPNRAQPEQRPDPVHASSSLHGFERDGPFLRFTVFLVGEVRKITVAFCESKPWIALSVVVGGPVAGMVAKSYFRL